MYYNSWHEMGDNSSKIGGAVMKRGGLEVAISHSSVHDLNDDSRLWQMEALYTRISPVLVCQTVPVRETGYSETTQKWTVTLIKLQYKTISEHALNAYYYANDSEIFFHFSREHTHRSTVSVLIFVLLWTHHHPHRNHCILTTHSISPMWLVYCLPLQNFIIVILIWKW